MRPGSRELESTKLTVASWGPDDIVEKDWLDEDRSDTDKRQRTYVSPDRARLREVLAVGGSSDIIQQASKPLTSERIEFFTLTACPLQQLLQPPASARVQFFVCDPQYASQGSLSVEHFDNIGVGTFKTAHRGHLTLIHLQPDGLGKVPNSLVAAKRMHRKRTKKADSNSTVVSRYPPVDDYAHTLQKANLLYWGSSIMDFTYSFIQHFISKTAEKPPFDIPELRFVHAGVAVSHEQVAGNNVATASSIRRTYLLEEFIDTETEDFVKFIHNGNAVPLLQPDDPLYSIAEFLCFTQHVQYFKTDGAVFLSDLQGTATLLTDPQIMTSPDIAGDTDIFGEGNVGSVFKLFPVQHVCNKYCTWFQLPPMTQA
ncbi:hypothetical protein B0H11DRAFT_2380901 [Mycena galericulata]|nr:hypothetical protein B0H11DRAFT_2380901 [Mycena galericulata]